MTYFSVAHFQEFILKRCPLPTSWSLGQLAQQAQGVPWLQTSCSLGWLTWMLWESPASEAIQVTDRRQWLRLQDEAPLSAQGQSSASQGLAPWPLQLQVCSREPLLFNLSQIGILLYLTAPSQRKHCSLKAHGIRFGPPDHLPTKVMELSLYCRTSFAPNITHHWKNTRGPTPSALSLNLATLCPGCGCV